MATFEITGPDGHTIEIDAPEGATQEQINQKLAIVKKNWEQVTAGAAQQAAPAPQGDMLDQMMAQREWAPMTGEGGKAEDKGFVGRSMDALSRAPGQAAGYVGKALSAVSPMSDRGLTDRVADTAAFVTSAPIRMATRGQYGLGDVVQGVTGGMTGQGISQNESEFVENNPDLMSTLGAIGEVAPGVTRGLGQGVPPHQINTVPPAMRPNPQSGRLAQGRAAEAVRDVQAFDETQVPLVPLAFTGAPTRGVGKQLSETPVIGAPLHNNLESAYRGLAEARTRIADEISPVSTPEHAGAVLQHGLDRFRTQSLHDLEPGLSEALGINPRAPVPPASVMSQGAAQRAQQAAPIIQQSGGGFAQTHSGVRVPSARPRNQTLTARTRIGDLDDAQLDRVIRQPADVTSFATRQEALYEHAHRQLPTQMRMNESANPQLMQATNARNTFRGIAAAEQRSGIRSGMLSGRFGGMAERLNTNVTLDTLRAMRTEVGRALSNFGLYDVNLDRTQLRSIYSALSRDIENAYLDLRNRAYIQTRVSPNRPDYVPLQAAQAADRALYEFRRADRYTRLGLDRMDRFMQVVGANSPEMAVRNLINAANTGGSANMGLVRSAMGVLRPEERAAFASVLIREMGRPINSARGIAQEVQFSPQSFVTRYNALSRAARESIFGLEHARAIENLFRVSNRVANVEALTNFSRSGTNALNVSGLAGALAALSAGNVLTPAAIGGGGYAAAVLLSRPEYARWATRYMQMRAVAARAPGRLNRGLVAHINKLREMSGSNPELGAVLDMLDGEDAGTPDN